jgi:hypothetical protein
LSLFLRLFLPTAALVLLGGWLYYRAEQEQVRAHLMSHEAVNVGRGGSTLAWHTQTIVDDLHYLANHGALKALLDHPGPAQQKRLETDFATLMAAKPVYDQIRWLDAEGREVVRVDLRQGGPQVVPAEKLQYKGDRYYFLETLRLAPGEVYLSPLDLYIENGQVVLAQLDGAPQVKSRKAIYRALRWKSGSFELRPNRTVPAGERLSETMEHLLMDGLRELDELERLRPDLPPDDAPLVLVRPMTAKLRDLLPSTLDILQAVHNAGTVSGTMDLFPDMTDLDVALEIVLLVQKGYVKAG